MNETTTTLFDADDIISVYTREQAIADGLLIDVSATAKEVGIRYPVAVTQSLWHEHVIPSDFLKKRGQTERERLWDILWLFVIAARRAHGRTEIRFHVQLGSRLVELKAHCGPGDNGEPVITILLPNED